MPSTDANLTSGIKRRYVLPGSLSTSALHQLRTLSPDPNVIPRTSGVLRPGETVFVLGAPASGRATFLKVIANT